MSLYVSIGLCLGRCPSLYFSSRSLALLPAPPLPLARALSLPLSRALCGCDYRFVSTPGTLARPRNPTQFTIACTLTKPYTVCIRMYFALDCAAAHLPHTHAHARTRACAHSYMGKGATVWQADRQTWM